MRIHRCLPILLALTSFGHTFAGNITIQGTTSSIANGFTGGSHPIGSHFHSSNRTDLPPENPPILLRGVAEVGGFYGDEEVRGTSEFVLQNAAENATVLFDVLDLYALGISPEVNGIDGLFGQMSYVGDIDVFAYAGDNIEEVSDYEADPIDSLPLRTFGVGEGLIAAGDTRTVDVTEIYNNLVAARASNQSNAATALGIRLQMADPADPDSGAITFGNFRLLLVQEVPEPTASWPMLLGLIAILRRSRRA